jgi:hypothetical protein
VVAVGSALQPVAPVVAPLAAQEAETPVSRSIQLDVYATALAFYKPPRGQLRWIEAAPLGVERDRAPLDPGLVRTLIARLGDRFRPWSADATGRGGRLRLSAIEPAGRGRYGLSVGYRHHTEYYEGPVSAQRFLVGCDEAGCRILERGPAAAAPPTAPGDP